MSGMRGFLIAGVIAAAFASTPSSLMAQSLFGSRGLGVMLAPVDGRAAALGGLGVALPGPSSAMINPADAGDTNRRGVIVAIQPASTDLETAEGSDGVSSTRFPLVQLLLPVRNRIVLSAGYGAFLDQNWGVTSSSVVTLADGPVTATDRITSRGGIAQGRAGLAYNLTDDLSLGASVGILTGSSTREAFRTFDDRTLTPYGTEARSTYVAPLAALGMRYRIGSAVLVGAALTWMGDMTAKQGAGDDATETDIAMPLQVAAGGSARMLEDVVIAVSTRWTGWGATEEVGGATADDVLELGGGVEFSGITVARRAIPLRVGARWGGQPFSFGGESPSEMAVSFGLGGRLAGSEEIPAALVDVGVERGARGDLSDNGIAETFWRATISISLFAQ